ncbi:MAG TPA: VOC family protein [Pyrinomonadaceae bacterium]|jgi:predicted enzyme related to lactoylglutathione lyase|nr:VOC family protein [Pyrinomonadaceae bacterium]
MANENHPTFGNGKICYLMIPANDISASADFYESVFGWNVRRKSENEISFDDGVGEVSGMWVTGVEPQPDLGISIHIMVDDIKVTMEKIVASGGKITQEVGAHAPEITAKFSDPAGNVFALYQSRRSERSQET